jgi:hypothetical protein
MKNSVVDSNYYMLLGRPWFKDATVTRDWGNNVITVQGNGIVITILVNRKLGVETKRLQILVCYDLMEGVIDKKEDMIFETKPNLLSISTITLSKETILLLSVRVSQIKNIRESNLK